MRKEAERSGRGAAGQLARGARGHYNAARLGSLKSIYHRLIPARFRNPVGLLRRDLADRARRALSPGKLPDRERLRAIQCTPWVGEYLEVGSRAAASIAGALSAAGLEGRTGARVLDFGCGSGRVLRHLRDTSWTLLGCDVDADAVAWSAGALPGIELQASPSEPPLSWPAASFDAIYAVSVFTHFDERQQLAWRDEMHRLLRDRGLLLITTMGPSVIANFPSHATPEGLKRLQEEGFLFHPSDGAFNTRAAFHTLVGVQGLFSPKFELALWSERGLDGFQDMVLLRKLG